MTYGPKTKITKRTIERLRRNAQQLSVLEQHLFTEGYTASSEHTTKAAQHLIAASNIIESTLALRLDVLRRAS